MKSTPFSHFNYNEREFRKEEFEQIIKIISTIDISELKLLFSFYHNLYKKSEGNLLMRDENWKLLTYDMVRKYSLSQIWEYKDNYQERKLEFVDLTNEMYDCYLNSYKLYEQMTLEEHRSFTFNCFITSVIIDTQLTERNSEWHPFTEYGMIMHYEHYFHKQNIAI